jgi:hypothetical protein
MPPLALRFKRVTAKAETTVFLLCEPSDSWRKVKLRLAEALAVKGNASELIKLFHEDREREFADEALVSDEAAAGGLARGLADAAVVWVALNGEAVAPPA